MQDTASSCRAAAMAAAVLVGACARPAMAAQDYRVGDCVGPVVTAIDAGDARNGIPESLKGPTPTVMSGPGPSARPTGRKLPAGGAYTVVGVSGDAFQLTATRFAPPFVAGTVVGWVRTAEFRHLAPRNCP